MIPMEFHIIRPWWLLGLLPLLLIIWGLVRWPAGESAWRAVCDPHLLRHLLVGTSARRRLPLVVLALAWLVAIVALAGPTWSKLEQPVFQGSDATVLVLDLSSSMNAPDVKPSRLARARFKVLDLLERRGDGRTGLIVFAHDAFALSPLTDDANTLAALVPVLDTNLMPGQGSQFAKGLRLADELLFRSKVVGGEIIVIGDGVARLDDAIETAQTLRRRGRTVSVIGVGTSAGSPVPLAHGGFLQDADGAIVVPKLQAENLRKVATAGGGRYVTLTADDTDLETFENPGESMLFGEFEQTQLTTDQWREDGIWLVLALLPLGALAFRRGWILAGVIAIAIVPAPSHAFEWRELWSRPDQLGAKALLEGDAATAADLFDNRQWSGTAHYRAGQYDRAVEAFSSLRSADGHYNRGNALAKIGDLRAAMNAYEKVLELDDTHADALFNKNLIEELLRKMSSGEQGDAKAPRSASANQSGQQRLDEQQQGDEAADNATADDDDGRREEEDQEVEDGFRSDDEGDFDQDNAGEDGDLQSSPAAQARADQSEDDSKDDDTSEQRRSEEGQQSNLIDEQEQTMSEETAQSLEQWLRRIPDDPGGLLRAKFVREYRRRLVLGQQEESRDPW